MKNFLNQRGVNLVEALVALGLVGILAYVFMSTSQVMNQSEQQQRQGDFVEDMVMKNVSRLKSAKSETLPTFGEKLLREYRPDGELVQETSVTNCNNLSIKPGFAAVCIHYMQVEDEEVEFSNADSMKLPKLGQKLYKIDITGESYPAGRRVFRKIVIFKK